MSLSPDTLFNLLLAYRYWLLLPLACVEGPLVALLAGVLISTGHLAWIPTFGIMILGDFIPDTLFYWIGRLGHRQKFIRKKLGQQLSTIEKLWHEHTFKSVFIAKWTAGIAPALLMTAGLSRISLWRFLSHALPVTAVTYGTLIVVGYNFGSSLQFINHSFELMQLTIAIAVVVVFLFFWGMSRYAKRTLSSSS